MALARTLSATTPRASTLRTLSGLGRRNELRTPIPNVVVASLEDKKPSYRTASSRRGDSALRRAQNKSETGLSTWLDPMDFGFHSPMLELTNRLMEEMMSPALSRVGGATAPNTVLLDLVQKENEYVATAELPGFGDEDVSINIENRMVTIKAGHEQKHEEKDEETGRIVHSERRSRSFARTFRLPKDVDDENIVATMDKGILTLKLPRVAAELPAGRTIPVLKGGSGDALPETKE